MMPYETNDKAYSGDGYAYIPLADSNVVLELSDICRDILDSAGIEAVEYTPATQWHITLAYAMGIDREQLRDIAQSFVFRQFDIYIRAATVFQNDAQYIVLEILKTEDLVRLQQIIFYALLEKGVAISPFSIPANYKPHVTIAELPFGVDIPIDRINERLMGVWTVPVDSVRLSVDNYVTVAINHAVEIKEQKALPIPPTPQSAQSARFALDMASSFTGVNLSYLKHYFADYQSGFKMIDDSHWLAWYTNNFEDKEKEIISQKALREFTDKANNGTYEMPELWFHHIEGTRHGQAEKLFLIDHFALAYGVFDDTKSNPFVSAMKSWYDSQNIITLSHGFFYEAKYKKDGVYHKIRTYEISTLPAGREANPFTAFQTRLT